MIKYFNKLDRDVMYLNTIKAIYYKAIVSIILGDENLKALPLKLGKTKG